MCTEEMVRLQGKSLCNDGITLGRHCTMTLVAEEKLTVVRRL